MEYMGKMHPKSSNYMIMTPKNKLLTPLQSFYSMHLFLEGYFYASSSDSIAVLLGCMHFLDDGETADPVLWQDWCDIVKNTPTTPMQAFQAMKIFLGIYFQRTNSSNVINMLNDIDLVIQNKAGKEQVWQKWITWTKNILEHE